MPFPLPQYMLMKKILLSFLCAVLCACVAPSFAVGVGSKVTFPTFEKGHIYGEKITPADLRGKVVFFEYWGINCGPCVASMPHLVELQKKYGDENFIVIASHMQGMDEVRIKEFLVKTGVNFPVYDWAQLQGATPTTKLPTSILVGADGHIIAEGKPWQLDEQVAAAVEVAKSGYRILCEVSLDKYQSLVTVIVSRGRDIESKMAPVRAAAEGGDAEAKRVCDAYDAWLVDEKQRIARQFETDPMKAMRSVAVLKRAVPSVTDFDEQAQEIRENPTYRQLAAIRKKLGATQARVEKGSRVTPNAFRALRKSIEEARELEGIGVEKTCDQLQMQLEAMQAAVASADAAQEVGKSRKPEKGKKKNKRG